MNVIGYLGLVGVLAASGCQSNGDPQPATRAAEQRLGNAAENTGAGVLNTARTVGHGAVYGARQVGQVLSGTQGNPQATAVADRDRQQMNEAAAAAGQNFQAAGHDLTPGTAAPSPGAPVHPAEPPAAHGGGPLHHRHHSTH